MKRLVFDGFRFTRAAQLKRISLVLLAVSCLLLPQAAGAADGDLDPAFGSAGKTLTDFNASQGDQAMAVAIQQDGKIVSGGKTTVAPANDDFALARYTTAGALDTAGFGGGTGKVTTDFNGGNDSINSVAIQPSDGKIVAVGSACTDSSCTFASDFAIARYNTNGTLDTTFGPDMTGKVQFNFAGELDVALAVAIQPLDGKIVVAGFGNVDDNPLPLVLRYTTSGVLDPTFGGTGLVALPASGQLSALAIQANGKIVTGGTTTGRDYLVARLNGDGSLDSTGFGNPDGFVTTDFSSGSDDALNAIAIQPADGKIVAAGTIGVGTDFSLARYNTDGSLDTGFNGTGTVTTSFGAPGEAHSVLIQPDGKIVAVGFAVDNSIMPTPQVAFGLARYNANGTLDTTFGTPMTGLILNALGGTARSFGAARQADNKIVAVGEFNTPSVTDNDFVVARFQNTAPAAPCSIICPANVNAGGATPGSSSVIVNYPAPTTTGDCTGATIACNPPSGSAFPLGSTTVSCSATSGTTIISTCSFIVSAVDVCLQDDSNPSVTLTFNSATGDYRFTCGGSTFTGRGVIKRLGSTVTLTHNATDRRLSATVDGAQKKGTASLQIPPGVPRCTITDRNTTNNTCGAALP